MAVFVAWTAASWEAPSHSAIFWNSAFGFNGLRPHTGGCETAVVRKALLISLGDAAAHGVCVPCKLWNRRPSRSRLGCWLHAECAWGRQVKRWLGCAAQEWQRVHSVATEVLTVEAISPRSGSSGGRVAPSPSDKDESLACVSHGDSVTY
jgi:hypothetical protein